MGGTLPKPLPECSKEEIGDAVLSLGDKYKPYASGITTNGVDGELLAEMTEEEFQETLDDLNVNSRLHRRRLLQEFKKLQQQMDTEHLLLPAQGPVREVHISQLLDRHADFPQPEETNTVRTSHSLPTFNAAELLAAEEETPHLAPDFYNAIEGFGGHHPPIPKDDLDRVAQVQSYGLQTIEPDSDIAATLTAFVEMATHLFDFDFGDITFFDHESQFSFARVGLTEHISDAIIGNVYSPINYFAGANGGAACDAFLCKTSRSVGICNYPSLSKRTFVVHDIHADETFMWMKGPWPFRCYVGTPLVAPSGLVLGTLCLHNLEPRNDFGPAHEIQLEQVGKMVVQALENWNLRQSIERLEQERQTMQEQEHKAKPPTNKAALVRTQVHWLDELRAANAGVVQDAVKIHNELVDRLVQEHCGYHVVVKDSGGEAAQSQPDDGSFFLAFHDAVDAFAFALDLQKALYAASWTPDLLKMSRACDDGNTFRGLRVRVSVHLGPVASQSDDSTDQQTVIYDWTESVGITTSVKDMAHGGQILTTFDTWNTASFLAETKLQSPQVVDLGMHVVRKGRKTHEGVISHRILQLVPAPFAVKYSDVLRKHQVPLSQDAVDKPTRTNIRGRQFPEINSLKKLSKSFFDAPGDTQVTIAFIGTSEIEKRYEEAASIISQVLALAFSASMGFQGYQCQNNLIAFPNITEAVRFGLRLLELLQEQTPALEAGALMKNDRPSKKGRPMVDLSRLVSYGCVRDEFVSMEPHKTTGRADYFGKVVNRAARVAYTSDLGVVSVGVTAKPGMDASSLRVVDDPVIDVQFVAMKKLKGVEEEMAIFECSRDDLSIPPPRSRWD